jgi:hypothetical protein
MQFQNQCIETTNIKPQEKDASEMGFEKVNKILKQTKETEFGDIILQKLFNI